MERAIQVLLIIAGLINFVPVVGVLSAETLAGLYEIPAPEGDLLILMRHRAVLFGILGALIFASVVRRHLRPTAIVAGLASMLAFIVLALVADGYGPKFQQIILADVIGSVALIGVLVLSSRTKNATSDGSST